MDASKEFKSLMLEYEKLLDSLLVLEENKIRVIASGKVAGLEGCMRDEEAGMLRMKGLDSRRESLLEKMGLGGKTFRQIVESETAAQDSELQSLCARMQEKTELLKKINSSSGSMLQSRLIKVENTIANMEGRLPDLSYGRNGKMKSAEPVSKMKPRTV